MQTMALWNVSTQMSIFISYRDFVFQHRQCDSSLREAESYFLFSNKRIHVRFLQMLHYSHRFILYRIIFCLIVTMAVVFLGEYRLYKVTHKFSQKTLPHFCISWSMIMNVLPLFVKPKTLTTFFEMVCK